MLASLVRKQVLSISTDPLSPQRGQYSFSQGLLRTVAYETLSRGERKPRHVPPPSTCERTFPERRRGGRRGDRLPLPRRLSCGRDDDDAPGLRTEAIAALRRAARRAATVGAPAAAERAYLVGGRARARRRAPGVDEGSRRDGAAGRTHRAGAGALHDRRGGDRRERLPARGGGHRGCPGRDSPPAGSQRGRSADRGERACGTRGRPADPRGGCARRDPRARAGVRRRG